MVNIIVLLADRLHQSRLDHPAAQEVTETG
jgi:hypothetical protein